MAFVDIDRNVFESKFGKLEVIVLCAVIFAVPLLVSQQLITGTLVNAMLIYSALRIKGNWSYVPAVIPSIAAMLAGILFGAVHAVLVMLPFIWLSNMALIFIMKKMNGMKEYSKFLAGSAIVKTAMLSASILALASFAGLPSALIPAFTYLQLITAISGGVLAYLVLSRIR